MRMGVLDIGSNTGHLLIVDAFAGGPPVPTHSFKEPLRLAEHLDADENISRQGIDALVGFVRRAQVEAREQGCATTLSFATSAVRDAANSETLLGEVRAATGVDLHVVSGEDEARLTFLAVRRWFGWSSGRLGVFDIGGGSLELAAGLDEAPEVAVTLPLGAGRVTRTWFDAGRTTDELRSHVRGEIAEHAGRILRHGRFDHAVATSKTFRSLARMCGAAPSGDGPYVRRALARGDAKDLVKRLEPMSLAEIAKLPGVSTDRAHQMRAGAVIAEAVMDLFHLEELEICPWALREGILLDHLDRL